MIARSGSLLRSVRSGSLRKFSTAGLLALFAVALMASSAQADSAAYSGTRILFAEGGLTTRIDPVAVATDSAGNVYVVNGSKKQVEKFGPTGNYLLKMGAGKLNAPVGVTVDASGNVWVAETYAAGHDTAYKFSPTGTYLEKFPWHVPDYWGAEDVAVDSAGRVLAGSYEFIHVAGGTMLTFGDAEGKGVGQPFQGVAAIDTDTSGNVWVSANSTSESRRGIFKINYATGASLNTPSLVSKFATPATPAGIDVDASGNAWVAMPSLCRLQKFTATGTSLGSVSICGNAPFQLGGMSTHAGIALSNNSLWVARPGVQEVVKWTTTP